MRRKLLRKTVENLKDNDRDGGYETQENYDIFHNIKVSSSHLSTLSHSINSKIFIYVDLWNLDHRMYLNIFLPPSPILKIYRFDNAVELQQINDNRLYFCL